MDEIPRTLLDGVAVPATRMIEEWWAALTDEARAEVVTLCDEGRDGSFFAPIPDDSSTPMPVVIGGRFLPHDDAWGLGEWGLDRFEYILGHPEFFPIWEPTFRTFHIGCSAHPAARECLAVGRISAEFRCPLKAQGCPMRRLLSIHGRAVRLALIPTARLLVAILEDGP